MADDFNLSAPVRRGEELPLEHLEALLQSELHLPDALLSVEQFPAGYSNLTYLLKFGPLELVLRRPPYGNEVKSAHDMGREYRVLSHLCDVFPPAPRPVLWCDDETIIGAPFYVMERRYGVVLRRKLPARISLTAPLARRVSESLIETLAQLHSLDVAAAGLQDFGKPAGYAERQVRGWRGRYEQAATSEVPSMNRVGEWLSSHVPPEAGAVVVHNDYKYDNLLLDPQDLTRIVAVLDWEMATIGDPLMDLGTTLGYWVEAGDDPLLRESAFGPTALSGSLTRRELVERYASSAGRDVPQASFYYAFGLYKIAVIIQQIYARFVRGHTRDERFANLDKLVLALAEQAERTLDSDSV